MFSDTVLAVGSHQCEAAKKVVTSAATAAQLFATHKQFVHARYISPVITAAAWIATLQEWTTSHDLAHHVVPLGDAHTFVISHRADETIDMRSILMKMAAQIEALGDGSRPERIIGVWNADEFRMVNTTVRSTTLP